MMAHHPDFFWAVGIEDTNIGWPLRGSGEPLDEYAYTRHYEQWKSDLDLVKESGANSLRWGLPWYRINPEPDRWDWSWADQVIDYATELGITIILDLVHYGTPPWLTGSFVDPAYPSAVARYAGEVARRYAGRVTHYTPLNEPLITASFTGARAIWPPYLEGDAGWARVVVSLAAGIRETIRAIRAAQPDASIVHVEATHVWTTGDARLTEHRDLMHRRNFLPTDLVLGRVDEAHELYDWLLGLGISADELAVLTRACPAPDIIGLNYYPELSARDLVLVQDDVVQVAFSAWTDGLEQVLREFHERYGIPLMVSETGVEGDPAHLARWADDAVGSLRGLIEHGVDIVGFTWWPLFDFVDWSWGSGGAVVEEFWVREGERVTPVIPPPRTDGLSSYFRRMGLWRLTDDGDDIGRMRTGAADAFCALTASVLPGTDSVASHHHTVPLHTDVLHQEERTF